MRIGGKVKEIGTLTFKGDELNLHRKARLKARQLPAHAILDHLNELYKPTPNPVLINPVSKHRNNYCDRYFELQETTRLIPVLLFGYKFGEYIDFQVSSTI